MVQVRSGTALNGGRPLCHPRDGDFSGMQNARVMGSWYLPSRFKGKVWKARQLVTGSKSLQVAPNVGSCRIKAEASVITPWKVEVPATCNTCQGKLQAVSRSSLRESGHMGCKQQNQRGGAAQASGAPAAPQHAPDVDLGALGFNIGPAGFRSCLGSIPPYYFPIHFSGNRNIYPVPVPPLYLKNGQLSF